MDNLRDKHNVGTVPAVHQTMSTHLAPSSYCVLVNGIRGHERNKFGSTPINRFILNYITFENSNLFLNNKPFNQLKYRLNYELPDSIV